MKIFEKPLTASEEKEYLQRLRQGDMAAQEILIRKNMRLVAHMVKKYTSSDMEQEDMISIGTIGLIKGIKSFDPEKGSRLATYVAKCIDNELLMQLRSNKKRSREVSLNEPIGTDKEGNEISLMDFLESENSDVYQWVAFNQEVEWLKTAIEQKLDERERKVIAFRYGLYGGREMTQMEIARMMGISRSYVSRIEKKAIQKLREGKEIK
ncbi:MAG: RNA polymerase sporulation sigma factor SigK [Alistipes sp.]|nr:RNA polymerase sporulation sigma factor SigK [Alistipes sp.]